jgi:hypothetical protein
MDAEAVRAQYRLECIATLFVGESHQRAASSST